jgi:iron complex transport system substrate-binding protein
MQGSNNAPNTEELLKAKPDVVFVMDQSAIAPLDQVGLRTIFLAWRQPEDVKNLVNLMAQVFGEPQKGDAYAEYFDATVKRVSDRIAGLAADKRQTVLYFSPKTLSQPQLIAEWWIPTAGGVSPTNNGRTEESITFSAEQPLQWNPDVMIVTAPDEAALAYSDPRFAGVKAIVNKRVFIIPQGAHNWGNRTIEQPLTVLWAAQTIYPDLFKDVDLQMEVKGFYQRFFNANLTDDQVREILSGKVGTP